MVRQMRSKPRQIPNLKEAKEHGTRKGQNMGLTAFDLHKRKCKQCGKPFESRMEYAYKMERRKGKKLYYYFCSWHCLRQYENANAKGGRKGA